MVDEKISKALLSRRTNRQMLLQTWIQTRSEKKSEFDSHDILFPAHTSKCAAQLLTAGKHTSLYTIQYEMTASQLGPAKECLRRFHLMARFRSMAIKGSL
jgi:hypothetical protein